MTSSLKILQRYHYDAVDHLIATDLPAHASAQRFYQGNHLVTELGEHSQRTIFRHDSQPLAQHEAATGLNETALLATEQAHSLLHSFTQSKAEHLAYTAYGYHLAEGLSQMIGFTSEHPEPITGHYLLGQGTRAFNPVLMRFNSPDELSPFGAGGINCYAYCQGDPVNYNDPSGNMRFKILPRRINRNASGIIQNPQNRLGVVDGFTGNTMSSQRRRTTFRPINMTNQAPDESSRVMSRNSPSLVPFETKIPSTKVLANNQPALPRTRRDDVNLIKNGEMFDSTKAQHPNIQQLSNPEDIQAAQYFMAQEQDPRRFFSIRVNRIKFKQALIRIKGSSLENHITETSKKLRRN
ncbi:RHS repeat-associated core domain-containing protein [Pseudomonas sp. LB3P31]